MSFDTFERRKFKDEYGHYNDRNHAFLSELIEHLPDSEIEAVVDYIRANLRDESGVDAVSFEMSKLMGKVIEKRKKDLTDDYDNNWTYLDEAS